MKPSTSTTIKLIFPLVDSIIALVVNARNIQQGHLVTNICGLLCSRRMYLGQACIITSHRILWEVITYPCPRHLVMALLKTFEIAIISTVSSSNPKSTSALVWNPPNQGWQSAENRSKWENFIKKKVKTSLKNLLQTYPMLFWYPFFKLQIPFSHLLRLATSFNIKKGNIQYKDCSLHVCWQNFEMYFIEWKCVNSKSNCP